MRHLNAVFIWLNLSRSVIAPTYPERERIAPNIPLYRIEFPYLGLFSMS